MKNLYSQLYSLLPNQKVIPVAGQIDEVIDYLGSLKARVNMVQAKKERLMGRKRNRGDCSSAYEAQRSLKSPKIEVHEMGSLLAVILMCGVDDRFTFCEIIQILHEENVEVMSFNSSTVGDSVFHVVHGEVRQSLCQFGATKVSERLKRFVKESNSDVEMEFDQLWDFEIGTAEMWGLPDPTLDMYEGLPPNLMQNKEAEIDE
uniref:Uncharacterized protein n=2 Tax=Cajanus cajan TaxID=3821 RepID=A0A151SF23_CAJCA|nr:hypothetical protein KK1_024666 [Cajanus cajan]KYP53374.1 hypothetical protein KK1_024753 [Cajanus cajan]